MKTTSLSLQCTNDRATCTQLAAQRRKQLFQAWAPVSKRCKSSVQSGESVVRGANTVFADAGRGSGSVAANEPLELACTSPPCTYRAPLYANDAWSVQCAHTIRCAMLVYVTTKDDIATYGNVGRVCHPTAHTGSTSSTLAHQAEHPAT